MKKLKNFKEQAEYQSKKEIIQFIKKHITHVVALQKGFRDDKINKFIKYSSYDSGNNVYDEYIVMLDINNVLIQTYCDGTELNQTDIAPYEKKYDDLDLETLIKIQDLILYGDHFDIF
jgi:hypothetical protein